MLEMLDKYLLIEPPFAIVKPESRERFIIDLALLGYMVSDFSLSIPKTNFDYILSSQTLKDYGLITNNNY